MSDSINDNFGMQGRFLAKRIRQGEVEMHEIPNTVVGTGKTTTASRLVADVTPGSAFNYLAIGSGTGATSVGDTALEHEVYGRIDPSGAVVGSKASWIGSFAISGTIDISEYGVFNASTNGSMLARASGTAVSLISGDFLEVTYEVTVG